VETNDVSIRTLHHHHEMAPVSTVLQQIWGSPIPLVNVELLCAIAESGGYVAVAADAGNIIGASFGFLGRHRGADALHSHVTGVLPGVQHAGVGRAMKFHQREWAAARSIPWITWTFDPLVRRNARFNIKVLGAEVASYHENFYGPMTDAMNARDETDRLLVAWATGVDTATNDAATDDETTQLEPTIAVATPPDIVAMRRIDTEAAMTWRLEVRRELGDRLHRGSRVVGFSDEGDYLLTEPTGQEP